MTPREWRRVIAAIYADLRRYVNLFLPSVKLLAKQRTGAKVHKRYHAAATPLTDNEKKLVRMCSLKMQSRGKEMAATG